MKKFIKFRPQIKSRHPSHNGLRTKLPLLNFKSIVRLGSSTILDNNRIEINSVSSIVNSSNKLLMKQCFDNNLVTTANWGTFANNGLGDLFDVVDNKGNFVDPINIQYPIVVKNIYGSRGTGNTLVKSSKEFLKFMEFRKLDNYIYESFFTGNKEYRLHISKNGCFYTNRKMLKDNVNKNNRWFRNNSNCVWIKEDSENFDKPSNWDDVVNASVKALESVGLDIGAVDLKIQSSTDNHGNVREYPKFIVIEINSAPSFGEVTELKYLEEIPKLLLSKQ